MHSCTPDDIEQQTQNITSSKVLSDGEGDTGGTIDIPKQVFLKGGGDTGDASNIPK